MISMQATHSSENQESSGKMGGEDPVFYLCFLRVKSYGEYPPYWIRIDLVHNVHANLITPDRPGPAFYRVCVNDTLTIAEVPTREEADHLVERIIMEVSMRLCHMNGSVRRS